MWLFVVHPYHVKPYNYRVKNDHRMTFSLYNIIIYSTSHYEL